MEGATPVANDDELIAEGLRAFASLHRSNRRGFASWLAVGEGLDAGKRLLMARLNLNSINQSQTAKRAYSLWLRESGYIEVPPEPRKALTHILAVENRERIRDWYDTLLSEKQRLRWNHPTTIWANWQRHIGATKRRANTVLVSMALDSRMGLRTRVSEETYDVDIGSYVGLIGDLVGFLSQKFERTEPDIIGLINHELAERRSGPKRRRGRPRLAQKAA